MKLTFIFLFSILFTTLNAHEGHIVYKNKIEFTKEEKEYLKKHPTLTVQNELNWSPYNFIEDGKPKGFSIDYINLLAKKSNLKVKFISGYSWSEFLQMLRDEKIDALVNISKTENRAEEFSFINTYHSSRNAIYVKEGNGYINSLEALKNKKVALPKNFFISEKLKLYYPQIKQVLVNNNLEALELLSLGKVDATIDKKNVIDYLISKNHITNIVTTNYIDDSKLTSKLSVAVSKNNKILHNILHKAQDNISDEEINTLNKKWFSPTNFKRFDNFLNIEEKHYLKKKPYIKMCTYENLKPIDFIEKTERKGILIDTLRFIENSLDIKFESITVSSKKQAKQYLQDGKCDIIPTISNPKELVDVGYFTNPLLTNKYVFITQKNTPIIKDFSDVEDKFMSISSNSELLDFINHQYPNINILETKSYHEALVSVNENEVYFTMQPFPIASYYMSKYPLNNIFISRYSNISCSLNLVVNKKEKKLLSILNKTIDKIDEKNKNKILNNWTSKVVEVAVTDYSMLWKTLGFLFIVFLIISYRQYILNKHNTTLKIANDEIEKKSNELIKQKKLFQTLFDKSSDGVLLLKDRKVIDCNEASLYILQFKKDELLNKYISDLAIKDDSTYSSQKINDYIYNALEEGICTFEWLYQIDTRLIWLEFVLTSVKIQDENLVHTVIRDITKRKKIESEVEILTLKLKDKVNEEIKKNEEKTAQLIHQSKLAQMGEMLSMIAHQWRQPLTAISATTSNLLLKATLDEKITNDELKEELEFISEYSQHLSLTISDFRNFFKPDKVKTTITLEELLDKSLNIIKTSFESKNITLVKKYECHKSLNLFATEVQQVILNILKNAEDILIDKDILDKKVSVKTYSQDDYAIIEISDNAGGIPNDILYKIFQPYFSTKKEKEGTGLGLYMSRTIINEHCKGALSARNSTQGAIFTIKLPIET